MSGILNFGKRYEYIVKALSEYVSCEQDDFAQNEILFSNFDNDGICKFINFCIVEDCNDCENLSFGENCDAEELFDAIKKQEPGMWVWDLKFNL